MWPMNLWNSSRYSQLDAKRYGKRPLGFRLSGRNRNGRRYSKTYPEIWKRMMNKEQHPVKKKVLEELMKMKMRRRDKHSQVHGLHGT